MEISGKNIIVTGGASGIGKSLVEKFIKNGATVGVFDIDKSMLAQLKKTNTRVFTHYCDVSEYEATQKGVDLFFEIHKSIDVLVNNAGIIYNAPLVSFSETGLTKHSWNQWRKVIACDLDSVFYMTVHVVEKMLMTRTKGVIVNVSSIAASGNAGQSAYSAAKAGVNALTTTWARELGPLGIRVVGVAPGFTETETTKNSLSEKMLTEWQRRVPLRRLGRPDEISDGIISLITNDFFTGKVLELDGGLVMS